MKRTFKIYLLLLLPFSMVGQNFFEDFEQASNLPFSGCGTIIDPSSFANTIAVSHGTPNLIVEQGHANNQCGGNQSMLVQIGPETCGEGFYFAYPFKIGKSYKIEFDSKIWTGSESFYSDIANYQLNIFAANSIQPAFGACVTGGCLQEAPLSATPLLPIGAVPFDDLGTVFSCASTSLLYQATENRQFIWFYPQTTLERALVGIILDNISITEINQNGCQLFTDFSEGANFPDPTSCLGVVNEASVSGLHISHGTPRIVDGCEDDKGILMGIQGQSCGEGVFFNCYFKANKPYEITVTTMVENPVPPGLHNYFMRISAANGLQTNPVLLNCLGEGNTNCAGFPPVASSVQPISNPIRFTALGSPNSCGTKVINFVPSTDFEYLWIYPTTIYNASSNSAGLLVLDKICVKQLDLSLDTIAITGNDGGDRSKEADTATGKFDGKIAISPNPSNGIFTVRLSDEPNSVSTVSTLNVFNTIGQLVYSLQTDQNSVELDLKKYCTNQSSYFFLRVTRDGKTLALEKLVVAVK